MDADLKQVLSWVLGTVILILLSTVSYFGNRIVDGQDKMNDTLTTILVQQQDLSRRVDMLEGSERENQQRWKDREVFWRHFYETYDLKRKR